MTLLLMVVEMRGGAAKPGREGRWIEDGVPCANLEEQARSLWPAGLPCGAATG